MTTKKGRLRKAGPELRLVKVTVEPDLEKRQAAIAEAVRAYVRLRLLRRAREAGEHVEQRSTD